MHVHCKILESVARQIRRKKGRKSISCQRGSQPIFYLYHFVFSPCLNVFKLKNILQSGKNLSNYIHALENTYEKTHKVVYILKNYTEGCILGK